MEIRSERPRHAQCTLCEKQWDLLEISTLELALFEMHFQSRCVHPDDPRLQRDP